MAMANNKQNEAKHWAAVLKQLPKYEVMKPAYCGNRTKSYRLSPSYVAVYGYLSAGIAGYNEPKDKALSELLRRIEEKGTRAWWLLLLADACLYAREADKAVNSYRYLLPTFARPTVFI